MIDRIKMIDLSIAEMEICGPDTIESYPEINRKLQAISRDVQNCVSQVRIQIQIAAELNRIDLLSEKRATPGFGDPWAPTFGRIAPIARDYIVWLTFREHSLVRYRSGCRISHRDPT